MSKKRNRKPARPAQATFRGTSGVKLPAPLSEAKRIFPIKTVALALGLTAAVGLGVWFAAAPSLERGRVAERQEELLQSIEQGDGGIALDESFAAAEVDFYDGGNDSDIFAADVLPAAVAAAAEAALPTETGASGITATPEDIGAPPLAAEITGIGILTIEKIDLRLPVSEGVTSAQLKVGPGHVPQTPGIGETGNAVVAGHRNYAYGDHFNRLGEMAVGDPIWYQSVDGRVLEFEVTEILEVLPGDPEALWQPEDESMLTLYTCTPIRKATHRLLVRAALINEYEEEEIN